MARLGFGFAMVLLLSAASVEAKVVGPTAANSDLEMPRAVAGVRVDRPAFEIGMVVLDSHRRRVGTILKIDQLKDGKPAVSIDITGTPIKVRTSKLRLTRRGEEAILAMTPSEIRTAAILNTF
jgi:hypothetical protein